jgi:hypothetical protein
VTPTTVYMITNGTVVDVTGRLYSPPGTDPYLIGDGVVLRVVAGTVFLRRAEAVAALECRPVTDWYQVAQRVDAINRVRELVSASLCNTPYLHTRL